MLMLLGDLLIPFIMIVAGRMLWKHCPGRINRVIGYRTSRSMKNTDTWKFANTYCARLWWKYGFIMLVPSALLHILFYWRGEDVTKSTGLILVTLQLSLLFLSIFQTECALKQTFHADGSRRQFPIPQKPERTKNSV